MMAEKNTSNIGFEKQIWDAAYVLRGNMDASGVPKRNPVTKGLSPIGTQCGPMGLNIVYGERTASSHREINRTHEGTTGTEQIEWPQVIAFDDLRLFQPFRSHSSV